MLESALPPRVCQAADDYSAAFVLPFFLLESLFGLWKSERTIFFFKIRSEFVKFGPKFVSVFVSGFAKPFV